MGRNGKSSGGAGRTAALVRQRIEAAGEWLWHTFRH
jgi:hypothetical protein